MKNVAVEFGMVFKCSGEFDWTGSPRLLAGRSKEISRSLRDNFVAIETQCRNAANYLRYFECSVCSIYASLNRRARIALQLAWWGKIGLLTSMSYSAFNLVDGILSEDSLDESNKKRNECLTKLEENEVNWACTVACSWSCYWPFFSNCTKLNRLEQAFSTYHYMIELYIQM